MKTTPIGNKVKVRNGLRNGRKGMRCDNTKEIIGPEFSAVLHYTSKNNRGCFSRAVCSNRLILPYFLASDGISKPWLHLPRFRRYTDYATTLLRCYATTLLPYYAATLLPYYAATLLPYYAATLPPYYAATIPPYYAATLPPYYAATLLPYYAATLPP